MSRSTSPTIHQRHFEFVRLDLLDPMDRARALDRDNVHELARSIKKLGLLQPPAVIPIADRYRIGVGNHRVAAMRLLGEQTIEAEIWPEHMSDKMALVRSLHENNVRKNESLAATLERLTGLMAEHDCDMDEAFVIARTHKPMRSKIKRVITNLSPDAMQFVCEHKFGISIPYDVARFAPDAATQMQWLRRNADKEMSRDEIIAEGKRLRSGASPRIETVSFHETINGVTFDVSMPASTESTSLLSAFSQLAKRVAQESKRQTPLLPHLMQNGGA